MANLAERVLPRTTPFTRLRAGLGGEMIAEFFGTFILVLLVPAIVGAASKPLASLVMMGTSLRFFLTAAYQLSGSAAWKSAAAAEGLVLAALAVYAALAFELEDNRLRTVLPTLRRGLGRQALSGSMADELAQVYREAGVRKQL